MSLPNSPADPYPEAFGWPWHGLIRRSASATSVPAEIVLQSGGSRPMASGAGDSSAASSVEFCWSHPFVVPGLPVPDIPAEDDQQWWARGIRRGLDGSWWWDRAGAFPACVRSGEPWQIVDRYFGAPSGGFYVYVRARSADGLNVDLEYESPSNAFGLPAELEGGSIRLELMMHGGAGDRMLMLASHSRWVGDYRRCGVVELVLEPENGTISATYHARYVDMYRVVSTTSAEALPSWTRYSFQDGDSVVLPYGSPPPDGFISAVSFSVGAQSYSAEEEWVFWGWYKSDAVTVELVKLQKRHEISVDVATSWTGGVNGHSYETNRFRFLINGNEVFGYENTSRADFAGGYNTVTGSLTVAGSSLPVGPTQSSPGPWVPPLEPAPVSGDRLLNRDMDYMTAVAINPVGTETSLARLSVRFLSNAAITMSFSAIVLSQRRLIQGAVASPSGLTSGSREIADADAIGTHRVNSWNSAAWNPVTGEVRRGDTDYMYNWV